MRMMGSRYLGASALDNKGARKPSLGMLVLCWVALGAVDCGGKPQRASLPAPEYERPALAPWHQPGVAEAGRGEPTDARTSEGSGPAVASPAPVSAEVQPIDAGLGSAIGSERP